jgi:hypothetical protein
MMNHRSVSRAHRAFPLIGMLKATDTEKCRVMWERDQTHKLGGIHPLN